MTQELKNQAAENILAEFRDLTMRSEERDFAAAFKQLKSALRCSRLTHWFDRRKKTKIPVEKLLIVEDMRKM